MSRRLSISRIGLIHLPTVALKVHGFSDPRFGVLSESGAYLGNVYRRIIPPSMPRVAAVIENELPAEASIVDIRTADHRREEIYKEVDWEGYRVEARRVGGRGVRGGLEAPAERADHEHGGAGACCSGPGNWQARPPIVVH